MGNQSRKAGRTNNLKTRNTQLFQAAQSNKNAANEDGADPGWHFFIPGSSVDRMRPLISRGFAQAAPSGRAIPFAIARGVGDKFAKADEDGNRDRDGTKARRIGAALCRLLLIRLLFHEP